MLQSLCGYKRRVALQSEGDHVVVAECMDKEIVLVNTDSLEVIGYGHTFHVHVTLAYKTRPNYQEAFYRVRHPLSSASTKLIEGY